MFESYRFAAEDDLDDFGYEEETVDIQSEVGEYGPEDEDEDELPKPVHTPAAPAPPPAPVAASEPAPK